MTTVRFSTQEEPSTADRSVSREEYRQITNYQPIIIIGMHRSGTSLMARLLDSLGLFLGSAKDENQEARFFQSINEWLLRQVGGAWDNPSPIRHLLENREIREKTTAYIRKSLLQSPRALSYLGWRNYLRHRGVRGLARPWGWKDPRNTFTLPLWLDIFPEAKVIHLHRSGMDVALSLRRRGRREADLQRLYRRFAPFHWIRPKHGGFVHSLRCDHLEGGLSLWREYVDEATRHVTVLRGRAFEISFECLVREPFVSLAALANFCQLRADGVTIERAARQINPRVLPARGDFQLYDPAVHSSQSLV